MAHKQKWQLTINGLWGKHLRKFDKRQFWKKERSAGKKKIANDRREKTE